MSQTIDDYIKRQDERLAAKSKDRDVESRMIQQAAVNAEALTGNPDWDRFLTFVVPMIDKAEQAFNNRKDMLPGALEDKLIRQLQIEHAYAKGRYDAYKSVLDLPQQIMDNVDKPVLVQ